MEDETEDQKLPPSERKLVLDVVVDRDEWFCSR